MLQKHVSTTQGSSHGHPQSSAGIQIRALPGTLPSAGSALPPPTRPAQPLSHPPNAKARKTRSLREAITKTVGTFFEAQKARQEEEEGKHLSEPVLRPLLTAAVLQHERAPITASSLSKEPQNDAGIQEHPDDILAQLVKNAVTCPIHESNLLALKGGPAEDALQLMQEVRRQISHETHLLNVYSICLDVGRPDRVCNRIMPLLR